jgi:hypothetical protein
MLENVQITPTWSTKAGRISHILVLNDTTISDKPYIHVQNKDTLDSTLLNCNIKHFQQAKVTPFTTSNLIEYLGEYG